MASKDDETTKKDEGVLDGAMDAMFDSNKKAMDYSNLGGRRAGEAQVDSGASKYKTKQSAKEDTSKGKKSVGKKDKDKVKQNVPQIGALGAFAALSGGMIGGVSMAATEAKEKQEREEREKEEALQALTSGKPSYKKKSSVLTGIGDAEVDQNRKFSMQRSVVEGDDEDFEDTPTVDTRGYNAAPIWDSDEGHHFQANYAHAHHVMPRMRRKKKTSISSDDQGGSDGETAPKRKSSGHGKRRGSKKEEIHHLPTIEDESKAKFGIGSGQSGTDHDDESEMDSKGVGRRKLMSESSGHSETETEIGQDGKFLNLKIDKATSDKLRPKKSAQEKKKSVMFKVGKDEDSEMSDGKGHGKGDDKGEQGEDEPSKRKRKRDKKGISIDDRRRVGSMVKMDEYAKMVMDDDELEMQDMDDRDIAEIAGSRYERMGAYARPKISRDLSGHDMVRVRRKKKHRHVETDGGETTDAEQKMISKMYGLDPADEKNLDRTPHDIFVQLSELDDDNAFWEEKSRWIKYEECKEEGAKRWGRPHLSSLSFHSLINLRLSLEKAIIILDYDQAKDFTNIAFKIVEEVSNEGFLSDDQLKSDLLRLLLIRHKFVDATAGAAGHGEGKGKLSGLKRSLSRASMANLTSASEVARAATAANLNAMENGMENGFKEKNGGLMMDLESGGVGASTFANLYSAGQIAQKSTGIMNRLKEGTEGTITLVGYWEYINEPICVFIRLAEGIILPNTMEVPIPVRFIFLLLTPDTQMSAANIDPHEVGRSFSTMMSNKTFHDEAYQVTARKQLLTAINEFLDSSVVLPSGDWESKNLISMDEIKNLRVTKQAMKDKAQALKEPTPVVETKIEEKSEEKKEEADDGEYDPMKRGNHLFSGVYNDIKNRFSHYLSDYVDGLNGQVVAATIFIYFAALSGAVAFGGLTGEVTDQHIGVSETMITSAVAGFLYALLSGQPLIITGLTGPILLYDTALWGMCKGLGIDFLQWRVWIGIWLSVIALVVAAFQGSVLVRYFTKFTKDIFASLVSLLFIFSALKKLHKVWVAHPLYPKEYYRNYTIANLPKYANLSEMCEDYSSDQLSNLGVSNGDMTTPLNISENDLRYNQYIVDIPDGPDSPIIEEPNTALLSFILMFGTFMIAYGLKVFRNSHYFGRTIRRALGDFGVPIGIVFMVLVDYLAGDTYSKKLSVPFGLQNSIPGRNWTINPFVSYLPIVVDNGTSIPYTDYGPRFVPIWAMIAAALPAFLLFLVLFIETEICELIMLEKSKKKGGGLHWDIVLLCLINTGCAIFGGPWICAATVRGVAHVSALTVMSTTHAPGEAPHIVEVKDQRVSAMVVSILVGVSVVLAAALQQVPFAVLYGVFLYMGVSGIGGIQLFDRLFLMLMPVKHHPRVGYTRRVKTWKMHLYTIIQFFGLGVLWAVKESPAALAFPFFVVSMIGLRWSLKFLFTEKELEHLDGPSAGKAIHDENDEPDFYEEGIGG